MLLVFPHRYTDFIVRRIWSLFRSLSSFSRIALLSLLSTPLLPWLAMIFNNANWALATLVIGIVPSVRASSWRTFLRRNIRIGLEKLVAKITVLDLGAGAAVHLQTEGANWLFDCGSDRSLPASSSRVSALGRCEPAFGVIAYSRRRASPWVARRNCWTIFLESVWWIIRRRTAQLFTSDCNVCFKNVELNRTTLAAGDSFRLSRDVTAHVLFPPRNFSSPIADDQAYVIRVARRRQRRRSCSCRTAGVKTEEAIVSAAIRDLRSDIVVKGQHHSGESGSDAFPDAVQPRLIIATSRDFPESRTNQRHVGRELAKTGH